VVLLVSRQVSWLAGRSSRPVFPRQNLSDVIEQKLAAYSCGGSAGLAAIKDHSAPASLLATEPFDSADRDHKI
jgi:hypothetical protein